MWLQRSELWTFFLGNFVFCLVGTTVWCFWLLRKLLRDSSVRSMRQLSLEMSDLSASFESLRASHQRQRSRENAQKARDQRWSDKSAQPSAGLTLKDELRRRAGLGIRLREADTNDEE